MERFGSDKKGASRERVIAKLLKGANQKAAEVFGPVSELPGAEPHPLSAEGDSDFLVAREAMEGASGMQTVEAEELARDDQAGDDADQWLKKHDPKLRGGEQ